MKRLSELILLCLLSLQLIAQNKTQTLKGNIKDKESQSTLPGVVVMVYKDSTLIANTASNEEGFYKITNLPIGKYNIKASFIGYLPFTASNVEISSGKETQLNIEITESAATISEVVIEASNKAGTNNEMAVLSARTFSIEDANRYAGSRGEPARMAQNFAGVNGGNDSRNDIIIRGNSPMGVVWRLEGLDIPNPNHFTVNGNTGGPVSIINNKILANSDFLTGAFPAEYGNGTAGVFDLKMRNGNNEKHEYTAQVGFLGTEISGEGPINKKSGASYLFTYRYSTLQMVSAMNIRIGTDAIPQYQDGSFRLNFPLKRNYNLSIWGIGGVSTIDILPSKAKNIEEFENSYGISFLDQYFGSGMGVIGATLSKQHNTKVYSKLVVGSSRYNSRSKHFFIVRDSNNVVKDLKLRFNSNYNDYNYYANYYFNYKITSQHSLRAGILNTFTHFNYLDSISDVYQFIFTPRIILNGDVWLLQPFVQYKYKPTDKLQITGGLHGIIYNINGNSKALEPRLGIKFSINTKNSISLGGGLHSQNFPPYINYQTYRNTDNRHLGLTKAAHAILGYDLTLTAASRIKIETYYQYLYQVPVEVKSSSYSLLNAGAEASRQYAGNLTNKGKGINKGIELTIEQFFSKSFFFLLTGSVYDSKYLPSDGIWRNSAFNGQYATNALAGKEFKIKDKNYLNIGVKYTRAGGKRYSPLDVAASALEADLVEKDSERYTLRFKDYQRFDFRVTYKINAKRTSHEISFDIVNLFNIKNPLSLSYQPVSLQNPNGYRVEYQLGRLPLFNYKIDF